MKFWKRYQWVLILAAICIIVLLVMTEQPDSTHPAPDTKPDQGQAFRGLK